MINKKQLLEHAKTQEATDTHICAGASVLFRVGKSNPCYKAEINC